MQAREPNVEATEGSLSGHGNDESVTTLHAASSRGAFTELAPAATCRFTYRRRG
jgi:hypothetical protein